MSSFLNLFLILVINLSVGLGRNYSCIDYYWRDYYGAIPEDAVPAGSDRNGRLLYIGQVYIRGYELLTATIYPERQFAETTAYAKTFTTTNYVKILCSPYTDAFRWLSINSKDLEQIKCDNILVDGGSEVGERLYVGRISRNGEVVVGKVFRHERSNRGIWVPPHFNSLTYDILTYDCDKANTFKIDVRNVF